MTLPAARAREGPAAGQGEPPFPLEPADEVHVLHQRQGRDAADAVVDGLADEQGLVPVGQREKAGAQRHRRFHESIAAARSVDGEAERTADDVPAESSNVFGPTRLEPGVRVQEEQPVSRGAPSPRAQLGAP